MIGSVGGGGGTDWARLGVDQMWAMVAGHDDPAAQRLLAGWRRSADLTGQHLARVKRYRDGLATAWPPARSPAAAAHLDRLDALIGNLRETYEAAVANHRALAGASGALAAARREMAAIHREHTANQARLAEHADLRRGLELGGGKGGAVVPPSPVEAGRQAELAARARRVMSALSTELAQAQTALARPAPYRPGPVGGIAGRPAITLPLPDRAPRPAGGSRPAGAAGAGQAGPWTGPPAPSPARPRTVPQRLPAVPQRPPAVPERRAAVPERRVAGQPLAPLPAPGGPGPRVAGPAHRVLPPTAVLGQQPGQAETTADRRAPRPAGHVIGGPPGKAAPSPAAPGPSVNPVGGLIGRPPPSAAPPPPSAAPSPLRDAHRHPDPPWAVAEGVDPVLRPAPEPAIDPGPVIGRTADQP